MPPVDVRPGAGALESSLALELGALTSANPLAGTLGLVALKMAAAADAAPAEDLKQVLAAVKELRSIIDQITKSFAVGGEPHPVPTENASLGPFGALRPEVVHAP